MDTSAWSRPAPVFLWALLLGAAAARLPDPPGWGAALLLALLGLALRRREGVLLAIVALAGSDAARRDVEPHRTLERWCQGAVVEARGELVEGWRDELGGWSTLLRLEAIGPPEGTLETARGADVRVVVRSAETTAGNRQDQPALLQGESKLRVVGRCGPPSVWHNTPRARSAPRLVVPSIHLVEEAGPASGLRGRLVRWRTAVLGAFAGSTSPQPSLAAALARGLVLGQRELVPYEVSLGLRRFGLAHLLAISGLHVGLIASLAGALGYRFRPRFRLALVVGSVVLYGFIAGPSPSVLRAVAMVVVGASALLLSRRPRSVDALAWALATVLLLEPAVIRSLAFQLTAAATAGILTFGLPWTVSVWRHERPWRWLAPLAIPIAAQLGTLPWALSLFCRLHPAAPLLDVVAVAWLGVFLAVSIVWLGATAASPALAPPIETLLQLLVAPLVWLLDLPAAWWQSVPIWLPLPAALAVTALLGLACWSGGLRVVRVVALLGSLGVAAANLPTAPRGAELVALDVGQGDALLLRDSGKTALIDGGGWPRPGFGQKVLAPALAGLGVRKLDFVVVTHGDRDHCGGLVDLTREQRVAVAFAPAVALEEPCLAELRAQVGALVGVAAGDRLSVGRLELEVLGPGALATGISRNEASLVIRVDGLGRRLLLAGDIERRGELSLVIDHGPEELRSDLLKVPHHGSRSSSTGRLVDAVRPRLALVSVGRNNTFGHPAREVIDRLDAASAAVLRTDRHGQIRVSWDENRWWVHTLGGGRGMEPASW